jgi:hypothetical protein
MTAKAKLQATDPASRYTAKTRRLNSSRADLSADVNEPIPT